MPDGGMGGPMAGAFGLETKFCQVEQAISVTDGVRIEGYASLFGRVDQGGDVVERGAYAASLARLKAAGRAVKLLWQHDPTQPIGIWDEVAEDEGASAPERARDDDADAREDGEPREPGFLGERVSLRLRAWPLIQMLEKAHAADKPIVWGV